MSARRQLSHGVPRANRMQEARQAAILASLESDGEDGTESVDLSELYEQVLSRLEIVCRADRRSEEES
jgi:hypothetical protein